MVDYEIYRLGDLGDPHEIGNESCLECWPGYPHHCECGGLIHASFGDENVSGDYWLYKGCDRCGNSYKDIGAPN